MQRIRQTRVGLFLLVILGLLNLGATTPGGPAQAQDNCQTFTETGFIVCGRFLEYWQANGGLTQQGYPISAELDEKNAPPPAGDGQTHRVQYFQRARFEAHPENAAPYDVLLGLLGTEQYEAKYGQKAPTPQPTPTSLTCQNFKETGFTVCGRFLEYWQANGGLAQQGYPISPLFEEQNAAPPAGDGQKHIVQYFQRARFEAHPENTAPYDVLLGLLGTEQYKVKTTPPSPTTPPITVQPTPTPTPELPPANGPVQPYACLPGFINIDDVVQACVDNPNPSANSDVTLYSRLILAGRAVPNTQLISSWKFPSGVTSCKAMAGESGVASCVLNTGNVAPGSSVVVTVYVTFNGQIYNGSAAFTTK